MSRRKKPYEERLRIPVQGDMTTEFRTRAGTVIAIGYERVVIGGRGPYVEFSDAHIQQDTLYVPHMQQWRFSKEHSFHFYHEYRSRDSADALVYHQLKTVNYADYKVGMWYVSPFILYIGGELIIDTEIYVDDTQLKIPGF